MRSSPQNIINHILKFNRDSINNILIKLYNINNEKYLQYFMMFSQKSMMNPFYLQNMNFNMQNNSMNMGAHADNMNFNMMNNPIYQFNNPGESSIPLMYGFPNTMMYNHDYYPKYEGESQHNNAEN